MGWYWYLAYMYGVFIGCYLSIISHKSYGGGGKGSC
jgi:hypothetical protein